MARVKANNNFWKKKRAASNLEESKTNSIDTIKRKFNRRGAKIPTNVKVNPNVNIDEFAPAGATASIGELNNNDYEGVVTKSQEDSDEQKIYKRQILP